MSPRTQVVLRRWALVAAGVFVAAWLMLTCFAIAVETFHVPIPDSVGWTLVGTLGVSIAAATVLGLASITVPALRWFSANGWAWLTGKDVTR